MLKNSKHTEESKAKLRISLSRIAKERGFGKWMLGRHLSEETKRKISFKLKGRKSYPVSLETREKMSRLRLGKGLSQQTKDKLSEASRLNNSAQNLKKFYDVPGNREMAIAKREANRVLVGKEHKNKVRAFHQRLRQFRQRHGVGSHTLEEWERIKRLSDYYCLSCWKKEPEIKLTEDHIVPLSRGGTNDLNNIQPLCRSCNSLKWNKSNQDFRGMLLKKIEFENFITRQYQELGLI